MSVPDGFLPVRVINAATHEPVPRAFVTWTIEGGGRSEATTTIIGEALLEGVGTRPGILTVTAPRFQATEERLPEPPGILHDIALVPLPDTRLAVCVAMVHVLLPFMVLPIYSTLKSLDWRRY